MVSIKLLHLPPTSLSFASAIHACLSLSLTAMLQLLILWLCFHPIASGTDCPSGYALDTGPIPENQKVEWRPCDEPYNYIDNLECGSIRVPLDYTNASPGVITLRLIRLPADPNLSSGKSIVFNPGGPGVGGLKELAPDFLEYVLAVNLGVLIDAVKQTKWRIVPHCDI